MIATICFAAIVLALCIIAAIHTQMQINAIERAERLQRDYDAARKSHRPSREIGRALVRAKCDQIKQELRV